MRWIRVGDRIINFDAVEFITLDDGMGNTFVDFASGQQVHFYGAESLVARAALLKLAESHPAEALDAAELAEALEVLDRIDAGLIGGDPEDGDF